MGRERGNRENTDRHVLVTWVKEIRRLGGRTSRSGSISFTIRTSRMGSVTALAASVAAPSGSPSARGGWGLDSCV